MINWVVLFIVMKKHFRNNRFVEAELRVLLKKKTLKLRCIKDIQKELLSKQ